MQRKPYDSYLIGHITADEVWEVDDSRYPFFGGAGLFGVYAAYMAGAHIGLLTKMSTAHCGVKDLLVPPNACIDFIPCQHSTSMVNHYFSEDHERRELIVSSVADPFYIADIPDHVESQIYHIAGLIYGDYEDGMIAALAKRGKVAVDMQGYIRHLDKETNKLYMEDYAHKLRDFPLIDFLKTDAAEAEILTGCTDRAQAAKMMYDWGAKEILITHNTEVLVYDGKEIYTCPIRARNTSGRTGRGDTTFGIYITQRLNHSIAEALAFATAAVSLKMESPGPLKHTREEILAYQTEFYPSECI